MVPAFDSNASLIRKGELFLVTVQEIQREINTLGSKVRDTNVVREVLDMKSELEKIREQIQNFE